LPLDSPIPWFDDFVGIAYRYYDLRMNLIPLFHDFKKAQAFGVKRSNGGMITLLKLDS